MQQPSNDNILLESRKRIDELNKSDGILQQSSTMINEKFLDFKDADNQYKIACDELRKNKSISDEARQALSDWLLIGSCLYRAMHPIINFKKNIENMKLAFEKYQAHAEKYAQYLFGLSPIEKSPFSFSRRSNITNGENLKTLQTFFNKKTEIPNDPYSISSKSLHMLNELEIMLLTEDLDITIVRKIYDHISRLENESLEESKYYKKIKKRNIELTKRNAELKLKIEQSDKMKNNISGLRKFLKEITNIIGE